MTSVRLDEPPEVRPGRPAAPTRSSGDALHTLARGVGQTLITVGLVVLLFCFYELKVTNLVTAREQDRLGDQLRQSWAQARSNDTDPGPVPSAAAGQGAVPPPVPQAELGSGIALLHVPRFGPSWDPHVVVEGVSVADLKLGPGHIPGTAMPGQLGNMVISGHRTTYGAPFADSDLLVPGDPIVLETRTGWFTYTVRGSEVVAPTAVEVTYAVPGDPTATPTQRLLTFTTCNPKYSARQRLVVRAELTEAGSRDDGPPAALAAG